MNKATARERGTHTAQEEQTPPPGWDEAQNELARAADLALLLIAGHQPPSLLTSNNNSICRALQSSKDQAHLCEPYCGKAYQRALEAGGAPAHYRCHAGFNCFAQTIKLTGERTLAVIGGRAFHEMKDYRQLVERVRDGDLASLNSDELFQNILFGSKEKLDELAERIASAAVNFHSRTPTHQVAKRDSASKKTGKEFNQQLEDASQGAEANQQSAVVAESNQPATLRESCRAALDNLAEKYQLASLALLLRVGDTFKCVSVTGNFSEGAMPVEIDPEDEKLLEAARRGRPLVATKQQRASKNSMNGKDDSFELYPLVVGDEIKGMLLIGDRILNEETRESMFKFCRELAMPIEVLRLREELERRMRAAYHAQSFSERVNGVEPAEAYATILTHSAELMRAERSSLLLFDEEANELEVKAALGPRAEITREARLRLGDGIAGSVLSEGRPLVVRDVSASKYASAPPERLYKSDSFISYPVIIGGRKVGVLNVTDKKDGSFYDEFDLDLLEMIAPQMALALDRAGWHQKATEFQLLSITDPLTDLLNRRYLEERLSEELERSKRHRYLMSFMMIDIDDFKTYNDSNGHQAGDLALEMTAQALKSVLRSADVAARYGGEEFSVLLPQTSLAEAEVIAERIRRRVERTRYPHGKTQPLGSVTVSIGISTFGAQTETAEAVIGAADEALYRAKEQGKNRIVLAAATPPPTSDAA
ncbi:MAG: diguanylate cyclase [Pyrinomonadaceae bacterium]|nr:diguanylate cyclase [Pyrinomonadaceae bacterium]